jgi:hypothetical protein
MSNPQKVFHFLKAHPGQMFCDDCIGKETGVTRTEVNIIARTLALFSKDFRRISTACSQQCNNRDKESTEAISNGDTTRSS